VGIEHENILHCDGDRIRYARQMFIAKRGPSGSSWVNKPRTRKNIREYVVEWNTRIPRVRQASNLVDESMGQKRQRERKRSVTESEEAKGAIY
jgi:hypothetical protein